MSGKKTADDRFKKFGTKSFTAVTKTNDFIDYLENGKLMGTRCKGCGLVFFPPRADCYQCLSSNMEWFEILGAGTLMSFSKLEYAPAGFEADAPYLIALVDYGSYKIFGRIAGEISETDLKVGMALKAVANRLPNDQLNFVFKRS